MPSGEARKERLRKHRRKSPDNRWQRRKREKMLLKTLPQRKKGHRHAFNEVGCFKPRTPQSSSPLKDIKKRVRAKDGVCYEKSIMLINELKEIGDKPVLMGLIDLDGLPFHFFVKSEKYGIIDIYPEGNPTGKLEGGRELSERWIPPHLMNRIIRIVNIELYRLEGAVLENNIEKCKDIYRNLINIVGNSPKEEKMRLQDEVLQHLTVVILALEKGHNKIVWDAIERAKENFRYWEDK